MASRPYIGTPTTADRKKSNVEHHAIFGKSPRESSGT